MAETLTIKETIDKLSSNILTIPDYKRYWLIRTQSGNLYDTFIEHNIVGLEHNELNLSLISAIINENNYKDALKKLKHELIDFYDKFEEEITPQKISLIAGQIYRFFKEVKKGDLVIIPSTNSEIISFGEITEDYVAELRPEERRVFDYDFPLLKRVKWIKDIYKSRLDPYFYKVFTTHQAISNISNYAEIIERSLHDLFILDEQAHNVIRVEAEVIRAKDLFGLGYELLDLVDDFCEYFGIDDVSSDDFEVTININSPGKIDLKSKSKKGIIVVAFILLLTGGGLTYGDFSMTVGGIPALVEKYNEFETNRAEIKQKAKTDSINLAIKQQMWNKYKDNLEIKDPTQMIQLMKQVDKNQDLPK